MIMNDVPLGSIIKRVEVRGYDQVKKRKASEEEEEEEDGGVAAAADPDGAACSVYYCRFLEMRGSSSIQMVSIHSLFKRGMDISEYQHAYLSVMEQYDVDNTNVPTDKYSVAIRKLHVSVLPSDLPCRTQQRETIQSAIRQAILDSNLTRALYISGMPGTGKTATVVASIRSLVLEARRHDIPEFDFCEINCLRLHAPADAYTCLWRHLSGDFGSSKVTMQRLTDYFQQRSDSFGRKTASRRTIVCLVDEMDFLITTDESVVYNFFNWAVMPGSGLLLVGVSNIMDLPERLSGR